ncbi:MAG TPA: hypothetical protein VFW96_22015 [Thermomicrobiales bacterium]|nr:hypothetical protein [Thermomicrobiales bacterium]
MDGSRGGPGRHTLDALLRALVAELVAAGMPDPLDQRLTLAAIWDDLSRLGGERPPPAVRHLLTGDATPDAPPAAAAGPVARACARLVGELHARGIPDPLAQPCALGLVWAALCRLAGEEPPALVRALLAAPVRC